MIKQVAGWVIAAVGRIERMCFMQKPEMEQLKLLTVMSLRPLRRQRQIGNCS